jgi:uncharacterized protein YbjT (DUF2867 family)
MNNKILVLGSTGKTGKRVYSKLLAKNADVTPASRTGKVQFDWYDSNTWNNALQGIDTVYITFQPDLAVPQSLAIITAFVTVAKQAGVSKLVLLSGRGEDEAIACEQVVINSGLCYTILRCSFFMQNFSEGIWAESIAAGELVLPIVKAKEPFLDADDVADVAVEARTNSQHDNRTYELTGPELLTFKDVVDKFASHSGKNITLMQVSIDEYVAFLRESHIPEDYIVLIRYLFTDVLDGRNESATTDIETALVRKASSFDEFVVNIGKQYPLTSITEAQ